MTIQSAYCPLLPQGLLPATWGCSHGSGFMGDMIRYVEEHNSVSTRFPQGDRQAAWAGHVFVFVGYQTLNGTVMPCIVEAEWPVVKLSPATTHLDACWAIDQPLTPEQRDEGTAIALEQVGKRYNALAYSYFLAKLAEINAGANDDFDQLQKEAAAAGPICSGIMIRCQLAMGVNIGSLRTAAIQSPDFISPADGLRWGIDNKFMHTFPPANWQ